MITLAQTSCLSLRVGAVTVPSGVFYPDIDASALINLFLNNYIYIYKCSWNKAGLSGTSLGYDPTQKQSKISISHKP